MKEVKSGSRRALCITLLLCLLLSLTLSACQTTDENGDGVTVPQGMQDATPAGKDYHLFLPDDWTVDHSSGVTIATYATARILFSSFSSQREPAEYWNASREETESMFTDFQMEEEASETLLGSNAALRYKFSGLLYDGDGDGEKDAYGVTQYVSKRGGKMYVLTYMAPLEKAYEQYAAVVEAAVTSFVFTDGTSDTTAEIATTPTGTSGTKDITDPSIHDFHLYVPANWVTDLQNGTVSAYVSESDRTSISLVKNYPTNANTLPAYFTNLENDYRDKLTDYTLISKEQKGTATVERLDSLRYEFSATRGGSTYRFCQELFVRGSYVYTFTYTATDALYEQHIAEAEAILAGITFD